MAIVRLVKRKNVGTRERFGKGGGGSTPRIIVQRKRRSAVKKQRNRHRRAERFFALRVVAAQLHFHSFFFSANQSIPALLSRARFSPRDSDLPQSRPSCNAIICLCLL